MNTCNILYKLALQNLRHISCKLLMKSFIRWQCKSNIQGKSFTSPKKINPLTIELNDEKVVNSAQKPPRMSPSAVKSSRADGSPQNVSLRLYNKAQEIANHKDEIRKSLIPEYSFTPKLSSGTQKWLNSKSKKVIKNQEEEVAVVSGSKVLSFTKFAANVKDLIDSKIPTPSGGKPKNRLVTSRLDRRSDIIQNLCTSPDSQVRTHNKSLSKY